MAAPLDIGLVKQFEVIFPFIFMLVVVYTVLVMTPIFKEKKTVAGIIAFSLATMTVFFPVAVRSINLMAPWFVLLFIFIIFGLLAIQTLGIEEGTIKEVLKNKENAFVVYILIMIIFMIATFSMGKAISEAGGVGPEAVSSQESAFISTVFHPKVLGLFLIFMIAFFTLQCMSAREV